MELIHNRHFATDVLESIQTPSVSPISKDLQPAGREGLLIPQQFRPAVAILPTSICYEW